ncbi:MAG: peptidylprolyl isomerase [Anaerolineaceae bacterium]|nr:peptidylprolyl isomerase [Anaerolineaceae bacterium]
MLVQLHKTYPQDVRLVFRHFPLFSIHPNARLAAIAAEAAGKQGKFHEMKDRLFAGQPVWSPMADEQFRTWLKSTAEELELDPAAFAQDLDSKVLAEKIDRAYQTATGAGIGGTPFVLINGTPYQGPRDFASLENILKAYQITDRQFTECPPMQVNLAQKYTATLKTTQGDITLELYPDKAPVAVNSFIFLAQQGWYDDNPFYLVVPDFVALTGDPTGTGYGHPGYFFDNEISDLRFNQPGVLGMYNLGPNSNGSSFFITYSPQPNLDGNYTIFGQVVEGMDVLKKIPPFDPAQGGNLASAGKILKVTIQEE